MKIETLTRRKVLVCATATAAAVATQLSKPFIGKAWAQKPVLRLLMWQAYNIRERVEEFERVTGATFSPTFFDGNSEAFNKLKVGGTRDFDMVMADGFWPRLYFRQGLTKALDYSKIPNMNGVFSGFLPSSFKLLADETGQNNIAAPNCWGGYGITVNADMVDKGDVGSIELMLNAKYAGRLSTNSRFEENIAMMGILAATRMGTKDGPRPDGKPFNPYQLTDLELDETKRLLIEQKKLLLTRYQDYDALERLMRANSVWAAPEFAETYRKLWKLKQDGKVAFSVEHVLKPKEGGLGWVDAWMVSSEADSERTELAHIWINLFLQRESYANVMRSTGYGGVVDVRSLLSAEENELFFQERSDEASRLHMFDQPSSPEKWERIWSEVEAS